VVYCRASVSRVLTVISLALGFCVTAESAPKDKVLHSFNGSDGSAPWAGVTPLVATYKLPARSVATPPGG